MEELITQIIEKGVSIGVIVWFMFRIEKKLDELTEAVRKLREGFGIGKR